MLEKMPFYTSHICDVFYFHAYFSYERTRKGIFYHKCYICFLFVHYECSKNVDLIQVWFWTLCHRFHIYVILFYQVDNYLHLFIFIYFLICYPNEIDMYLKWFLDCSKWRSGYLLFMFPSVGEIICWWIVFLRIYGIYLICGHLIFSKFCMLIFQFHDLFCLNSFETLNKKRCLFKHFQSYSLALFKRYFRIVSKWKPYRFCFLLHYQHRTRKQKTFFFVEIFWEMIQKLCGPSNCKPFNIKIPMAYGLVKECR